MERRVFVGGMPFEANEEQVKEFFGRYNPQFVKIIYDRETGRSRGFGFVTFADAATAREVMQSMNNATFWNRTVRW